MVVYKRLGEVAVEDIAAAGVPPDEAARVHEELARVLRETGGGSRPEQTWRCLSRRVLRPEQPFALHQLMFYGCYRDYGSDTPPAWIPDLTPTAMEEAEMGCSEWAQTLFVTDCTARSTAPSSLPPSTGREGRSQGWIIDIVLHIREGNCHVCEALKTRLKRAPSEEQTFDEG
ncbi:hypothetical protein Taro_022317 [Colocasia esculenta]|uniref:Uncharacterized protein n=1 Tax=Colocasia esculenta TaxID=4460 RepID=A0A843VE53_COLES|nr:hypothetical protein [Colocasia esculenta]